MIDVYGSRAPSYGRARVLLDGKAVEAIDAFAADEEDGVLLFSADNLDRGSHVLELVVLDPPQGRKPRILVDAMVVRGRTGAAEQPWRLERRGVKSSAQSHKSVKKSTSKPKLPRRPVTKSSHKTVKRPTSHRIAKSRKPSSKVRTPARSGRPRR